jgi:protein XagA
LFFQEGTVINDFIKAAASLIVTATIWLSAVDTCFAGAWTMQKGKLYDRMAFNYYYADDEFNKRGDRTAFSDNSNFRDLNLNNYIEYGLLDNLTLINSVYYKEIKKKFDNREEKTWGIGDIDLGAKTRITELAGGILSTQALFKFPWLYDKDDALPLGNGQVDFELRLLYGHSLYPYIPGYCNFELGYRWRLQDPSDEVRYLVEFGLDFTRQFYGRVKLDGIYSMDNGNHFDLSGNPTTTNNFDLGKLDMTLGYKLSKEWGLEINCTPEIYGKNTASGATYAFAITYQIP